jgi:hypothetical protein
MKTFLATKSRTLLAIALTAAFAGAAHADVIMDWNAKADAIAAEKQVLPAQQSRAMSMLHIAMFEAVNAIERRYTPYKLTLAADRSTSKEAAASAAAYDILLAIYPDQNLRSIRHSRLRFQAFRKRKESRTVSCLGKRPPRA